MRQGRKIRQERLCDHKRKREQPTHAHERCGRKRCGNGQGDPTRILWHNSDDAPASPGCPRNRRSTLPVTDQVCIETYATSLHTSSCATADVRSARRRSMRLQHFRFRRSWPFRPIGGLGRPAAWGDPPTSPNWHERGVAGSLGAQLAASMSSESGNIDVCAMARHAPPSARDEVRRPCILRNSRQDSQPSAAARRSPTSCLQCGALPKRFTAHAEAPIPRPLRP